MKQALLTIGMTVFNDESILEPALDRLKATAPPGTRLVVFDNRSTDRSPEILARYGAIVTRGNLPQADALNVLAAGAMSKYLLLLHGDVFFLSPTWFDACAAELEKGHALVSPDDCGLGGSTCAASAFWASGRAEAIRLGVRGETGLFCCHTIHAVH